MSGPKHWVSSKIHRKTLSRSNLSTNLSSSPLDDRTIITPPMTIVDIWSGSTTPPTQRGESIMGEPPTEYSNSSLDSGSTWLTQSPSTTPPKKTWERNYKSFLKKTGKQSKTLVAPSVHRSNRLIPHTSSPGVLSNLLPMGHHSQHSTVDDFGANLVEGFEEHSQHSITRNRLGSAPSIYQLTITSDDSSRHSQQQLSAPHSPAKSKDSSLRGGVFFKRLQHNRTKSVGTLDVTMRKGVDRKNSPTTTPLGSAASTPNQKRVPLCDPSIHEGIDGAADLEKLLVPAPISSCSLPGAQTQNSPFLGQDTNCKNDDNLDHARHHGVGPPPKLIPPSFSRVQSMTMCSTPVIPEGKPPAALNSDEDGLMRERKKVFTDFHNTGVDSSSAYLGDESSLHRNSVFLSSMAYPVGSAGVKGRLQTFVSLITCDCNVIHPAIVQSLSSTLFSQAIHGRPTLDPTASMSKKQASVPPLAWAQFQK